MLDLPLHLCIWSWINSCPGAGSKVQMALNPIAPTFHVPTSTLYIGSSKNALLQTAQVILYNTKQPSLTHKLQAVLDFGSKRLYATDTFKKAFNLESKEVQQLSNATFGTTAQDPRDMESYMFDWN